MRLQALLCGTAEVRGLAKLTRALSQRLRRVLSASKPAGFIHENPDGEFTPMSGG